MADSDDEYDRKRRDKFRGERERSSGDYNRSDRRDERPRGREDWTDRGRGRPDYRDYRRYSPDRGPPVKRMRQEWGDDGRPIRYGGHDGYMPYGGGGWTGAHDHYPMHGGHAFGHQPGLHSRGGGVGGVGDLQANGDLQTQPPMLTLKQFLATQDDSISDADAMTKYSEYKQDFKRQQLNEFFVTHKDEEWFKIKYHPEDSNRRKEEQLTFLRNRAEVFTNLLNSGDISNFSVDTTQTEKLLRLLDTIVIKLEGGTDEDLKVLDEPVETKPFEHKFEPPRAATISKGPDEDAPKPTIKPGNPNNPFAKKIDSVAEKEDNNFSWKTSKTVPSKSNDDEEDWDADSDDDKNAAPKKKQDDDDEDDDWDEGKTKKESTEKDWDDDPASPDHKDQLSSPDVTEKENDWDEDQSKSKDESSNILESNPRKRSRSESTSSSSSSASDSAEPTPTTKPQNDSTNEEINEPKDVEMKSVEEVDTSEQTKDPNMSDERVESVPEKTANDDDSNKGEEDKVETIDLDKESDKREEGPTHKALHRTSSIFLRNLAPTITKAEVEAMCKRYNGFLRVAIADPLVERRWFRRGWVTFERDVNIKEICWNLNNIRLRDCELGAIVNRDLSRRVRPVNGITAHKTIVRSDIKLCAKIAFNLDNKAGLWANNETTSQDNGSATFGLNSNNPVLQNITDYLIEEASAEEDELLGLTNSESKDSEGELLEKDLHLISVLDKLILYLRIVHSVDFYNHCEYPYEDEMPNRCGIIHARGPAPQNKVHSNEIQEYIRNFEGKMSSFLSKSQPIEEEELKKLGTKDTDAEVEKFVQANTQELAKDKWLCPLSGKKFKGPDFIRKHIFNKHGEKVDEVKREVEFFNNYLKDPKRPQLPEHPGNNRKPPDMQQQPGSFRPGGFHHAPVYAPYGYAPPMIIPPRGPRGGGYGMRRGGPGGGDSRPIIHYRDLDAPREPEDFL
ncbi:Serrate RNA effector molecule like [Pseudolycoriella hygida]|uniref:Serrate RNA effector molecule homolog n=1 Tax=Pseudolycoriella hygida TaxID=35572 RepID=A0A9Q0N922_9DIPT|nr:Serrate RNA effector molecule like [Pseudolycoriella hygida]